MPVVVTANPPDGAYDETAILTFNTDHSDRLKETIDNIEADTKHKIAYLVTPDPDATFQAFKSHFQPVEAAGGIVWNPDGAILLIFRHGKWDLPKGKIEQNESIAEAAEREVAEECGMRDPRAHAQSLLRHFIPYLLAVQPAYAQDHVLVRHELHRSPKHQSPDRRGH